MSDITELYENAGIKKHWNSTPYGGVKEHYPQFTAEKQIELIKWMVKINYSDERIINYYDGNYYCSYSWDDFNESELFKTYEEALACAINYIWQDLTEEEKQQVKGILE